MESISNEVTPPTSSTEKVNDVIIEKVNDVIMEVDDVENQNIGGKPSVELDVDDHLEGVGNNTEDAGETTDTSSEKNESRDFEDDDIFQCLHCKTMECIMWRKIKDGVQSGLVCNLCHLKHIKDASNQNTVNNNTVNQASSLKTTQSLPVSKSKDNVRISKRKNKTNKKFTNSVYGDKFSIKSNNSKSRRNLHKKKPAKSAVGVSSIVASQSIYHNGLLYQVGDIVCTTDVEGGTYYAQLRGFLQDDYCERAVVVTWLIPTQRNVQKFDPMLFVPGLDEDSPRPMDCFDFVCRATTGLFKTTNSHPPYLRSQTDLNNLIYIANAMNTPPKEQQDQKDDNHSVVGV